MKKFVLLFFVATALITKAQTHQIDTTAIIIFDRMSDLIGDLGSVSFTVNTSQDIIDVELGLVKYFNESQVYMVGPDKMMIHSNGNKGHRGMWYNGEELVYYSFTESTYAVIDTPPTIIETFDEVNRQYDIEFPAADFFYPTFTDDLIATMDDIILAGRSVVEGKACYHIITRNKAMGAQFWISDDEWFLPVKMIITYYDESPNAQYSATFSDWKVNPDLPNAMFNFTPPPKARKIKILAKSF
ncbi:MAG: DUF2092 domain-containing protein [Bacteroidales bacterium]|nr:DUF2092 domain-containing protein [Bacteroidales bacterium]